MKIKNLKKGFSLLEIMLVLGITASMSIIMFSVNMNGENNPIGNEIKNIKNIK